MLTLDGWQENRGAQVEIELAMQMGKPVQYLSPEHAAPSHTLAQVASELAS